MNKITNTLFLPLRFWRPDTKVVGEMYVRDDQALLVDDEGRVHYFKYVGTNLALGGSDADP
jgi:hypothetical protein